MRFILYASWFVLVGLCDCDDGNEGKKLQTREEFKPKLPEDQERSAAFLNDFSLPREPPKPGYEFYQGHHHHHVGSPDGYHQHHHHDFAGAPTSLDRTGADGVDFYAFNSTGIPLDFAISLNEYTVSDLLVNVIEDEPESMQFKPVILSSRIGGTSDNEANETERSAAQIARPAKCAPELKTVRIARSNDPNIFYVPECTRLERCGGCCSHTLLACEAVETETVTLSVIKTEYTGNKKLKYIGKEAIVEQRHTKCKCGCKIKEKDCNSYQEYREAECRCLCKNIDEERKCYKNSLQKLWNPELCACQCRDVVSCSTGFQFDFNECRCVQSQFKRRYILSKEQPEP